MRSSNSRAFARNRRASLQDGGDADDLGAEPELESVEDPRRTDVEDMLNRWVGGGAVGEVTEGNVTFLSAARRRSTAPADEQESLSAHVTPTAAAGDGADYTSVLLSFADLPPATPGPSVAEPSTYVDVPSSTSASEAANFNLASFYAAVHATDPDTGAGTDPAPRSIEVRRPERRSRRFARTPDPVPVATPPLVEAAIPDPVIEESVPQEPVIEEPVAPEVARPATSEPEAFQPEAFQPETFEPSEAPKHRHAAPAEEWSPFTTPRSTLLPAPTSTPTFGESDWDSAFAAYDGVDTDALAADHLPSGDAEPAGSLSSYVPAPAQESTVPTTLRWRSSRVPYVVIGTVLALLGMFALRAWIVAVADNTSSHVGVAGAFTALALISWWMLVTWPASRIEVTHGVLDYRRGEHHHRFDLQDPQLDVRVSGDPTSSRWNVVIRRPRIDPVVLTTRMVDPADFMRVIELYRVRPSELEGSAPLSR